MFEEIDELLGIGQERPPNAFTIREFADGHDDVSYDRARNLLKRAKEKGLLKGEKMYVEGVDGRVYEQWLYWPATEEDNHEDLPD